MSNETNPAEITQLLNAVSQGNAAARQQLIDQVYADLKQTAARMMRAEEGHSLQPTALVNEAYLRLFERDQIASAPNRAYFFAAAARAMRRVLVDAARRRKSLKRGGEFQRHPLTGIWQSEGEDDLDLIALDAALGQLENLHPRQAEVVQLRWFAGLTVEDVSQALGVSVSTIEQDWRMARAFLKRQLMHEPVADTSTAGDSADRALENHRRPGNNRTADDTQ